MEKDPVNMQDDMFWVNNLDWNQEDVKMHVAELERRTRALATGQGDGSLPEENDEESSASRKRVREEEERMPETPPAKRPPPAKKQRTETPPPVVTLGGRIVKTPDAYIP